MSDVVDSFNRLFVEPKQFNFFQAIRLIERNLVLLNKENRDLFVDFRPILEKTIQFTVNPALHFNASPIEKIELNQSKDNKIKVMVNFLGLIGESGVLPNSYAELIIHNNREKNTSLQDFLDIFHQRIIDLFYQAWKKYRYFINFEQSQLGGHKDTVTSLLLGLTGQNASFGLSFLPEHVLLANIGHFNRKPRNALGLRQILQDYLQIPINIMQFHGAWLVLDEKSCSSFGANNQLGIDIVAGRRVWQVDSKFRVQIGPITGEQLYNYLPFNSNVLRKIVYLIRYFVGMTLSFDIQFIINKSNVPRLRLKKSKPAQLGWNTWLYKKQFDKDLSDVVICETAIQGL